MTFHKTKAEKHYEGNIRFSKTNPTKIGMDSDDLQRDCDYQNGTHP